jgi:DNA-directed RNA polymerase subunit alpha
MFQIQCLEHQAKSQTEIYSKYAIGPFIKGQSNTIGNALRRILLSNLQGIAITGVRITGVDHEFATIPHVQEDVIDILLNLKQIIFKGSINEPVLARLSRKESGIITAKDIDLLGNISVVDSRQYIACLTKNSSLEMEFLISKGQNYITSGKIGSILPAGFLAVDAVFMPVKNVNFFVETSKSSLSTELESLILEISTNGSVAPAEALSISADILENTFGLFKITSTPNLVEADVEFSKIETESKQFENVFIEELELSVRAYNCLKRANVHTLADLLQYSSDELLEFKNFGQKSADEVCSSLKQRFDMDLRK